MTRRYPDSVLQRECPKCLAQPSHPCISLRRADHAPLTGPHDARWRKRGAVNEDFELTKKRRHEAVTQLRSEGLSFEEIGRRLGFSASTAYLYSGEPRSKFRRLQPDGTVRCNQCKECKPKTAFNLGKGPDGVYTLCRDCEEIRRRVKGIMDRYPPLDHPEGMKTCRSCLTVKPEAEFGKHLKGIKGRASRCRECIRSLYAPGYVYRDGRKYSDVKRDERLRRVYGITLQDYQDRLVEQEFRCPICLQVLDDTQNNKSATGVHVDHRHCTGVVRGLLSYTCNVGIGSFQEDLLRMARAIAYLARHNGDVEGFRAAVHYLNACEMAA